MVFVFILIASMTTFASSKSKSEKASSSKKSEKAEKSSSSKKSDKSEKDIAHGRKNNCVGEACMAMGKKDLARAFDQLRAKVNSGRGITESQFRSVVDQHGLKLETFAKINDKSQQGITKFRETVKKAVGNDKKDYFINFGDHMEAISKGKKPDILLEHYKRTGEAEFMEVSAK
jgi:hypothetical protein